MNISQRIASELNVAAPSVQATIALLDEGATVPFIARYRKEVTGGLDDTQLRQLSERLGYLRDLADRKAAIIKSIDTQGKLTPSLREAIQRSDTKTHLEDLYAAYKPKRRSKALQARELGLGPLAEQLLASPSVSPATAAQAFVSCTDGSVDEALDGARAIIIEGFSEDPVLIGRLRERLWSQAKLVSTVIKKQQAQGEKFKDYFDYSEALRKVPSHRALAVLRGKREGILRLSLAYRPSDAPRNQMSEYERMIMRHFALENKGRPADAWLHETVHIAWTTKIFPALSTDAINRLKAHADTEAITVFSRNLKDLLLAAPAGRLATLGLDPGFRSGIKVAVIDDTGKVADTAVVFLHKENESLSVLSRLLKQHSVALIAIGNGTASRETDALVARLLQEYRTVRKVIVSEAGASVYSASALAAQEFPHLDVSLRGAVSIARRLQDPLAELVKIEPKAIGVGQYQHDVNQPQLADALDAVVEDCVNAVGVDVNTASASLLEKVAGLNTTHARNIVAFRDEHGAFKRRSMLLKVPRLGAKTFEQAAGFLRIRNGDEPLDASSVHPESYGVVRSMIRDSGLSAEDFIGNKPVLQRVDTRRYLNDRYGLLTLKDILCELEKPGRDPRGEFKTAAFSDEVNSLSDLQIGMILQGVVSNVANFGAFIDIGVHQDGLVHISALSNTFVKDPHDIVKAGDVVTVKVIDVDEQRKRIALSMCIDDAKSNISHSGKNNQDSPAHSKKRKTGAVGSVLSEVLSQRPRR